MARSSKGLGSENCSEKNKILIFNNHRSHRFHLLWIVLHLEKKIVILFQAIGVVEVLKEDEQKTYLRGRLPILFHIGLYSWRLDLGTFAFHCHRFRPIAFRFFWKCLQLCIPHRVLHEPLHGDLQRKGRMRSMVFLEHLGP